MEEYICGVDPSYKRSGIALIKKSEDPTKDAVVVKSVSITAPTYEENKYQLEYTMEGADWLARKILKQIKSWSKEYNIVLGVIEYPVLATRSGAYLGLIQQAMYMLYPWLNIPFFGVPSNAIKSISKYKSKAELVDWCQRHFQFDFETHRRGRWIINHDESSAVVLALIGLQIRTGVYKKSKKAFYKLK